MTTPAEMALIQPPVGGLNWRKPATSLDPTEALHLENILPRPSSGELRHGYKEFAVNLNGAVRSIMSYKGLTRAEDRLFAVNDTGEVYDVTSGGDTHEAAATIVGDGVVNYTNSTTLDNSYLCVVSESGGYWTFSPSSGWEKQDLTGDAADKSFSAIFKWKDRIWLIGTGSTKAYYLGIGAITGEASEFDFAPILRRGGHLAYGANWTFDAGYDLSDYFVLVTTQGEVIVYEGTDPGEASTFKLKGVWNVGQVPDGSRSHTHFGGELMIMSSLGVVPMSRLVNGQVANEYDVASAKIQPILEGVFAQYKGQFGWELTTIYDQAFILLKPPQRNTGEYVDYVMSTQTGAWATVTNMPMSCTVVVDEKLYFGTPNGAVCQGFEGDTDGQKLDGTQGSPIIARYLGGFRDFDKPGLNKKFTLVRPFFVSSDRPSVLIQVATQYGNTFPSVQALNETTSKGATFNVDKWNQCTWTGGVNTYESLTGVNGLGFYGALNMAFTGLPQTQFTSATLMYQTGGVL